MKKFLNKTLKKQLTMNSNTKMNQEKKKLNLKNNKFKIL